MADGDKSVYRYSGNKDDWNNSEVLRHEGQTAAIGETLELTEEEAEDIRSGLRVNLTKLSEDDAKKLEEKKEAEQEEASQKRGSQQTVASGAQAPASTPDKDKKPGAPGAGNNDNL